ncbi:DUF7936 family protein [Stappia sp. ICDLI1TA098]
MTITYSWTFPAFETAPEAEGLADVVRVIHWRLRGETAGFAAEVYGAEALEGPDAENFTAFGALTQAQVVDWITARLDVAELEALIAAKIAGQQAPATIARPAPWV